MANLFRNIFTDFNLSLAASVGRRSLLNKCINTLLAACTPVLPAQFIPFLPELNTRPGKGGISVYNRDRSLHLNTICLMVVAWRDRKDENATVNIIIHIMFESVFGPLRSRTRDDVTWWVCIVGWLPGGYSELLCGSASCPADSVHIITGLDLPSCQLSPAQHSGAAGRQAGQPLGQTQAVTQVSVRLNQDYQLVYAQWGGVHSIDHPTACGAGGNLATMWWSGARITHYTALCTDTPM